MCNNNSNFILENFFTEQLFTLWTLPIVHPREVMLILRARGLRGMEQLFLLGMAMKHYVFLSKCICKIAKKQLLAVFCLSVCLHGITLLSRDEFS
jgi:hypothetical protein